MTRAELRKFFLSARGCIVVLGTPAFFILVAMGLMLNAQQGTLTLRWGLWIVLVSAAGAAITGALIWYVILRPFYLQEVARKSGRR
jgi:hypothetical protein